MKYILLLLLILAPAAHAATYYVGPAGAGSTCSEAAPCSPATALAAVSPGDTILMLNGEYKGADYMIVPTTSGTSGNPITIRAVNDGKVFINGENARIPINLVSINWHVIEGVNAHSSTNSVVVLGGPEIRTTDSGSCNNIVRRVCAWDARPFDDTQPNLTNYHSFSMFYESNNNLIEDCAAWGSARKNYQSFRSTGNTMRRCFAMAGNDQYNGYPFSVSYKSYDQTLENCIGTSYGTRAGTNQQVVGIFAFEHMLDAAEWDNETSWSNQDPSPRSNAALLGSIAYLEADSIMQGTRMVMSSRNSGITVKDVVAVIETGYSQQSTTSGFYMDRLRLGTQPQSYDGEYFGGDNTLLNLSGINITKSPTPNYFNNTSDEWPYQTIDTDADNVYSNGAGANICYEYRNRVRTTRPLWPWKMETRIKDALNYSGHKTNYSVTRTIERLLGPIPAECRECDVVPVKLNDAYYIIPGVCKQR